MAPNEWDKYHALQADDVLIKLLQEEIDKLEQIHGKTSSLHALNRRRGAVAAYVAVSVLLSLLFPSNALYLGIACSLVYFLASYIDNSRMKDLMAQAKANPDTELSQLVNENYYIIEEKNHLADRRFFAPTIIALCLLCTVLLSNVSAAVRTSLPTQPTSGPSLYPVTFTTGTIKDGIYTWSHTDEGCVLVTYDGWFSTSADIPSSIEGKPVIAIAEHAFENETLLRSVTVPDCVTKIESYAFKGCTGLSAVKLSDHLITLGGESFNNCKALTSMVIPAGVTEIRGNTFQNCVSLKAVTLHENIIDIHAYAFKGCTALESITLPIGITEIHANTFEGCSALRSIIIPEGVTRVAAHAFRRCSSLSSVSVPSTLRSIGSSAFRDCLQLNSITIPKNCSVDERAFKDSPTWVMRFTPSPRPVQTPRPTAEEEDATEETDIFSWTLTDKGYVLERYEGRSASVIIPAEVDGIPAVAIGDRAFEGKYKLTHVSIPDSVTEIGTYAFNSCMSLSSVELSSNLTSIGEFAFIFTKIESLILPEGITEIRGSTFAQCNSLQSIIIPEGVTRIGNSAFLYCENLTDVTIPSTVKEIDQFAFSFCKNLTKLEIPADCIIIASDGQARSSFYDCDAEIIRK